MSADDHSLPSPFAAIDLGSNSFRLEIGQFEQGRYRRLDRLKETVRLGGGLDAEGMLQEDAVQRALDALRRFGARLTPLRRDHVRVVATQTLREARNRDAFLQRAQDVLGHPIEVISGREEARLIFAGVALLDPSDRPRLVIDIGGRSTELVLGRGQKPEVAESFQVGSVALSMRYFANGMLTQESFRAAQVAAGAEFEEAQSVFRPQRWREALGASGTVGAVSQVLYASGVTDGRITRAALQWFVERCLHAGHTDNLQLRGLEDDRRPVIAGGLAILSTLFAQFGIEELMPAKGALRQGVIVDLHDRLHAERAAGGHDVRDESVRELQERFGIDTEQARRVRDAALANVARVLPGDEDAAREIGWACDLHEAGMLVSHHDHHRHSAYLISNADAPGFSQSLQRRIGRLLLGQRGGLRKLEDDLANDVVAWQMLCLRLAVILCHARTDPDAAAVRVDRQGKTARVAIDRPWAREHARTLHLLRQEVEDWQRGGTLALELPQDFRDSPGS